MTTISEERRGFQPGRPSALGSGTYFVRHGLSWSGIAAGAVVALALQSMGGLLTNVFLSARFAMNPLASGLTLWFLAYNALSMFVGGFAAGRQASGAGSNAIHALTAWAAASLATLYLRPSVMASGASQTVPLWMFGGLLVGLISAICGGAAADTHDD